MFLLVGVLLGVAFFTLFERKILGYIHFRKGPTKVFYFGLFQPIADALKLFSKEVFKGNRVVYYFFILGPLIGLFLMIILWGIYGGYWGVFGRIYSIIYFFCFLRLGVYFLLFRGWGGSRKYSLVGGYRAVSQTVSYEVSIIFFVLVFVYFVGSYDLFFLSLFQFNFWFVFLRLPFFFSWIYVCLAESNRTPFDFSEGESELVSGFNIEYRRGVFSLIFICEYGMIIFIGFLRILIFLGRSRYLIKLGMFCFFYVWVRCTFPRYRYMDLMDVAWGLILPLSLSVLFLFCVLYF